MRELLRHHHISFTHAFAGFWWALRTQPNFRIHALLSLLAVGAGYYFQVTLMEWIVLVFAITLGFATEMANTAIEAVTDLVTKEWRKEAKIAKDVAAAMMLVVAMGTVIAALLLFYPYIVRHFS